jgi:hypothetical protein
VTTAAFPVANDAYVPNGLRVGAAGLTTLAVSTIDLRDERDPLQRHSAGGRDDDPHDDALVTRGLAGPLVAQLNDERCGSPCR